MANISIIINKASFEIPDSRTFGELLSLFQFEATRVAAKVNGKPIEKDTYDEKTFRSGDILEIVNW